MYTSASKNLCTFNVIISHFKRWLSRGYLLKSKAATLKLPANAASVTYLLGILEQEGYVDLVTENEMSVVTVCYNSEAPNSVDGFRLPFVYKTKSKTIIPAYPVREKAIGSMAWVAT